MRDLCKALVAVGITTMLNGLWPLKYPVASGALTVLAGAIGLYFFPRIMESTAQPNTEKAQGL